MQYELFWVSGSSYSWTAMYCLEHMNLPYQSLRLDLAAGDLASEHYRNINPRGKVPSLRYGDTVVFESLAILAFLNAKNPEYHVFGNSPEQTGRIWQSIFEINNYGYDTAHKRVVMPQYRNEQLEDDAVAETGRFLSWLESALTRSPYIASDSMSGADMYAFPLIESLHRGAQLSGIDHFGFGNTQRYPATTKWLSTLQESEAYAASYPPHWR